MPPRGRECLLGAGNPAAKEREHRSEVPLVEDAKRLSVRARVDETDLARVVSRELRAGVAVKTKVEQRE